MSKKINIEGKQEINDPFYRYTMSRLNVVRQRNKTVIDNLKIVSKDLDRDPKFISDYFRKKLNVAIVYKNGLLSTTADIKYEQFYGILREFVECYVLCEKCRLPETIMEVEENTISLDCKCCSYLNYVSLRSVH